MRAVGSASDGSEDRRRRQVERPKGNKKDEFREFGSPISAASGAAPFWIPAAALSLVFFEHRNFFEEVHNFPKFKIQDGGWIIGRLRHGIISGLSMAGPSVFLKLALKNEEQYFFNFQHS